MQTFDIAAKYVGIIGNGPASTDVLRRFAKLNVRTLIQSPDQTNDDRLEEDLAEYQQVMYLTNPTRSYGSPVIVMDEGEVVERVHTTKLLGKQVEIRVTKLELLVENGGFVIMRGDERFDLSRTPEPTVALLWSMTRSLVRGLLVEGA